MILAVPRWDLFKDDSFEGFRSHYDVDYQSRILKCYGFMKRGPLEADPNFKQPIAYAMIVNPELKKVFAYQRSEKGGEGRLHGKWSWGIGGHIEKSEEQSKDPIYISLLRELNEEVVMNSSISRVRVLGYLNDESDTVGEVHFGILYVVETSSTEINPRDLEIKIGGLKTLGELEKICSSQEFTVEGWSKIAFEPLKLYLQEL